MVIHTLSTGWSGSQGETLKFTPGGDSKIRIDPGPCGDGTHVNIK